MTKRDFERLTRRAIKAFVGDDVSAYHHVMDEACVECSGEQWEALKAALDAAEREPVFCPRHHQPQHWSDGTGRVG